MDLRYAGYLSQRKEQRFEEKCESASFPSPGYLYLFDTIRRIDSRDTRVQIGLILKKVHMPPFSDNRIVDTTQLAFIDEFRSPFEVNVDVYFQPFLFYIANVPRFH